MKELQRQASPSIVIALAGNKSDLAAKRMVDHDEALTYAEENGLLFMETSAKTAMNVTDIFLEIGRLSASWTGYYFLACERPNGSERELHYQRLKVEWQNGYRFN